MIWIWHFWYVFEFKLVDNIAMRLRLKLYAQISTLLLRANFLESEFQININVWANFLESEL